MPQIRNIHQMQVAAATENSIGNEVLELRAALRAWGYGSEIYAEEIAPSMRGVAKAYARYRPSAHDVVIFHYSTWSRLTDYVRDLCVPLILVYHNVTPSWFLAGLGGGEGERARRGRMGLAVLRDQTTVAVARSDYSRIELEQSGYSSVCVVPVVVPDTLCTIAPDSALIARHSTENDIKLLFVGRVAPNKRQEDVIKVLYYLRQINPRSRLFLVGSWNNTRRYADWLRHLVHRLDMADAVQFCGHVSNAELAAYYRLADVFVCMSEHEGFGIPLVEAMRFGVPVIAYASSAIPETMGGAGILLRRKHYPVVAELIQLLQMDAGLRQRIVAGERTRAEVFAVEQVLAQFRELIREVVVRSE